MNGDEGPIVRWEAEEPCECWCGCTAATLGDRCSDCSEECRLPLEAVE